MKVAEDAPRNFTDLGISPEIVKGLDEMGITTPTNIQVLMALTEKDRIVKKQNAQRCLSEVYFYRLWPYQRYSKE